MMLNLVNRWIEHAGALLKDDAQIPLINDRQIRMDAELQRIRESGDDDELLTAVDTALARNPDDLAARFVGLNSYYRLLAHDEPEEISYRAGGEPLTRENILKRLAYLVRLREVQSCTDAAGIRWEIVNASAIKDFPRMIALSDRLAGVVPDAERYYVHGRLHFLAAILHTLDTEELLEHWDLPLGPAPRGLRYVHQVLTAAVLISASTKKFPARGDFSDDDRDHFRDAVKFLEKAISSDGKPRATVRFMLAQSYAGVGDGANAARHYKWMLDHGEAFFQSWKDEESPLWGGDDTEWLCSFREHVSAGIHACLIDAYDAADELDKAIQAAKNWIEACPKWPGTFERMARLHQKRCDPFAAAEYMRKEAERREELGDKAYGEDPNVSIILALGEIVSGDRLDEILNDIATGREPERRVVEHLVRNYWPGFCCLSLDDQQRWVTASWLLATDMPHGPGLAVHCFGRVVERELRNKIFSRFSEFVRGDPALLAGCADDPFGLYLKGRDRDLTLGKMFKILSMAQRPESQPVTYFAGWLKRDCPRLLSGVDRLRTDRIAAFRNREAHPDVRSIRTRDAELMCQDCRAVIDLLGPR